MNKIILSVLLIVCFVLVTVPTATNGRELTREPPTNSTSTLFAKSALLTSENPAALLSGSFAVPRDTEAMLRFDIEYFWDTTVCFMFGITPPVDKYRDWNDGYCANGNRRASKQNNNFFQFSRTAELNTSSIAAQPRLRKHTQYVYASDLQHWYAGAIDHPSYQHVSSPTTKSGTLTPRFDHVGSTFFQYFVAVGITEKQFLRGQYSNTVSIKVHQTKTCPPGEVGPSCQGVTSFVPSVPTPFGPMQTGPEGVNIWEYYSFDLPQHDPSYPPQIDVTIDTVLVNGMSRNPVKAYVRWQGIPYDGVNQEVWDYNFGDKHWSYTKTMKNPQWGRYYIGIQSDGKTMYQGNLTVAVNDPCEKENRFGYGCKKVKYLSNVTGAITKLTATSSDLVFLKVNRTSHLLISASSDAAKCPPLYLGAGFVPTDETYTIMADTGDKVNRIETSTLNHEIDWFIGVGSGNQESISVSLWGNSFCAQNCKNRGNCTGVSNSGERNTFNPSGECDCKHDYTNFYCQDEDDTDFKLEYIILIAVGGAILLVIAVGVPIYCFVQKKKSEAAGYETLGDA
eukprot:CAMPEP_0201552076 /NCGR_PEP_ID=MMETSP0173_2-20130828/13326_1 /ASSEMBLY_ACC=CAM_ASM_000268 /TAXON_ID=218659 /ORGANISM="Vexillifera sp., Strain DIVA3 564/2" /LENGTH=564 /DNA_ID=CAMNT_0047962491 /DNA_START=89 /DNA_END=1783 /DNA_ORIENTATION=+